LNGNQNFHLLPTAWNTSNPSTLRDVYVRAFSNARELFIVSAFLTEWPEDLRLSTACTDFSLVVGADFGTTRKAAIEAALEWLPKRFRGQILAFNQRGVNFHPKAILWRENDGNCYFLIGSSNLTKAAFNSNVEANVTLRLDENGYAEALAWKSEIEERSVEITKRWLDVYKEAPPRGTNVGGGKRTREQDEDPVFDLALELQNAEDIKKFQPYLNARRRIRAAFDAHSKELLLRLFRATSNAVLWTEADNETFYEELIRLWGPSRKTRMGGRQWAMRGRYADHQELAKTFVAIYDARGSHRDDVVLREMERLQDIGLATRSAALTELLCHFFPEHYPILDGPVRTWRSWVGFDKGVGGSAGARYLRLARAMRAALRDAGPQRLDIRNLAELDTLIWFLVEGKAIDHAASETKRR